MDSSRRPTRKNTQPKRKADTMDNELFSKAPRLSVQQQTKRTTPKSSSKSSQKVSTLKKVKKPESSKIPSDSPCAPQSTENHDNFIEALEFVRKESRRCQVCSKTYDEVNAAHECLHSHKNTFENAKFRCYFCFNLFKDTDMLFEHYQSEHRHAEGMENKLLCNYCDKKVMYKSVSVHVISQHAVLQKPEENCISKINTIKNLEENYKDEGWRYEEAKKCHGCSKSFLTIPAALECLKGHRLLRCYFCFSTFDKTHLLFEHYNCAHKRGTSKNSVICEFCGENVTHKAAVNHVINCHLSKVI